jgi:lipoprotein-releasing system permease protein
MRYEFWIALRYFLAKRRTKFISLVSLISILGVAVGVTALIVVLAVMSGFDHDLEEKIIGIHAHLVVEKDYGIPDYPALMQKLSRLPHVQAVSPYINGQAMLIHRQTVLGIGVRGIDEQREFSVTRLGQYLKEGSGQVGKEEIVIGAVLAEKLALKLKDTVILVSPYDGRNYKFAVAGIFSSGMYEYDANIVFINLASAQDMFGLKTVVSGLGIKIDKIHLAGNLKQEIYKLIGYNYYVLTWMDLNKNLFSALKLEKTVMFIILTLIIIVAAFNIASTLIMFVLEKTKDIGILKAIGATNNSIKMIFSWEGMIIGILGTLLGAIGGFGLCGVLKNYDFIKLPPDIYYIDRLPVKIERLDSFLVIFFAILISYLATLHPARQAARLNPVEALRYE